MLLTLLLLIVPIWAEPDQADERVPQRTVTAARLVVGRTGPEFWYLPEEDECRAYSTWSSAPVAARAEKAPELPLFFGRPVVGPPSRVSELRLMVSVGVQRQSSYFVEGETAQNMSTTWIFERCDFSRFGVSFWAELFTSARARERELLAEVLVDWFVATNHDLPWGEVDGRYLAKEVSRCRRSAHFCDDLLMIAFEAAGKHM